MKRQALSCLKAGVVVIAAIAMIALAAGSATAAPNKATQKAVDRTEIVHVDQWLLLQSSGEQLYEELCASCHGAQGAGAGPAAMALPVYPPPLDRLRRAGVSKEHWTYVILASCEDGHHWGPQGTETMPCWKRVFRQALGDNNAAPMLVEKKLRTYLSAIQK